MAEILGTARAVISLVQAAKILLTHVSYLHSNPSQKRLLEKKTHDLIELLEPLRDALPNSRDTDLIHEDLQSVVDAVQSIATRRCFLRCLCATMDHGELKEAERKLDHVTTQVLLLRDRSVIANDNPDLPSSEGGLDRCAPIFNFLQNSEPPQFRVICIHGLPGIGKTTLLNRVWAQLSLTAPFTARAYVQIGHGASAETIRMLQESLVEQIGNIKSKFASPDLGRGQLKKLLQEKKGEEKPLFLAIDNVFKEADLEELLPDNSDLPASSCLIMTCRDYRVVTKLLNILSLQEDDRLRVFIYEPPCLDERTSTRVFADCAGFQPCDLDEYQDLLKALVPMCGGLPLALTVLGSIFKQKERRREEEWEALQKQMASLTADNEDTSPITTALELSYNLLHPSRQHAFLDMVSCFYGWGWEVTEDIVGKDVMRSLKSSSLIYAVDNINKCNRSAVREGWWWISGRVLEERGCVAMHDLTLRFGEGIVRAQQRTYPSSNDDQTDVVPRHIHFLQENGNRVRILCVSPALLEELGMDLIKGARFKRTLFIVTPWVVTGLRATLRARDPDPIEDHHLRCVDLQHCNSSTRVLRAIQPPEEHQYIRRLSIEGCGDLIDLDALSNLRSLKTLSIQFCMRFRGFSSAENWESLQVLSLTGCPKLVDLPDDLGRLPKLRVIEVFSCASLRRFPGLRNPNGLSLLRIRVCRLLREMPALETDVKEIAISHLPMVEWLRLDSCVSLTRLEVTHCEELREIHGPSCGAKTEGAAAASTSSLRVEGCPKLRELQQLCPPFRGEDMDFYDCPNLTGLPDGARGFQNSYDDDDDENDLLMEALTLSVQPYIYQ